VDEVEQRFHAGRVDVADRFAGDDDVSHGFAAFGDVLLDGS